MYDFLYSVSLGYSTSAPGTCCDPRYTYNASGTRFEFEKHYKSFEAVIKEFNTHPVEVAKLNSSDYVEKRYRELQEKILCIPQFWPVSTQDFIQISSLLV